jgi:hypothetical protein
MSHQVIRTTNQVTGQKRVSSCAVKRNTGFNTIPRAVAWDNTVVATRHQAINIFGGIGVTILGQILEQLLRFENPRSRPRAS